MHKHVTAVGVLQIGLGVLDLMGACLLLTLFGGAATLTTQLQLEAFIPTIIAIVGGGIIFLALICAIPQIVGGIGLLMYKNWARYLLLVVAVLELFNIPIGTAVGAYTIWALVQDETVALFNGSTEA